MSRLSNNVVCVTRIAAVVGTFQSLIWTVACVIAILSYNNCLFISTPASPDQLFGVILHEYFFLSQGCLQNKTLNFSDSEVVDASLIRIWVIISLSFNLCWLVSSLVVSSYACGLWRKNVYFATSTWAFFGGCIVVMDFTLGVMLGVSYTKIGTIIQRFPQNPIVMELVVLQFATLCLMTIAFKGYVMLIINILTVLSVIGVISNEYTFLRQSTQKHQGRPIRAYGSMPTIGRVAAAPMETTTSWRQKAIDKNYGQPKVMSLERVNYINQDAASRNLHQTPFTYNESRLWPSSSISRSPSPPPRPRIHHADYISRAPSTPVYPEPDYSPLGQRRLKSALKTTI